jgi:hypothetical protein
MFEHGQAYVALSRAVSLDTLTLTSFNPSCIKAHPEVVHYYNSLSALEEQRSSLGCDDRSPGVSSCIGIGDKDDTAALPLQSQLAEEYRITLSQLVARFKDRDKSAFESDSKTGWFESRAKYNNSSSSSNAGADVVKTESAYPKKIVKIMVPRHRAIGTKTQDSGTALSGSVLLPSHSAYGTTTVPMLASAQAAPPPTGSRDRSTYDPINVFPPAAAAAAVTATSSLGRGHVTAVYDEWLEVNRSAIVPPHNYSLGASRNEIPVRDRNNVVSGPMSAVMIHGGGGGSGGATIHHVEKEARGEPSVINNAMHNEDIDLKR